MELDPTDWNKAIQLFGISHDEKAVKEYFFEHPHLNYILQKLKGKSVLMTPGIPSRKELPEYSCPKKSEYWPAVLDLHKNKKNWGEESLVHLDDSTSRIMQHLISKPHKPNHGHYGLVIGYVQSGKTSNYTALCAKAADYGYNLVIILSGLFNDLREQTQSRLLRELAGKEKDHRNGIHVNEEHFNKKWKIITQKNMDFHELKHLKPLQEIETPHLIVTKKNVTPLEKIEEWIQSSPIEVREQIRALIIDDEADHGSIDTQTGEQWNISSKEFETSESEINRKVRLLLRSLSPGFAYVGYTATPMANLFINPEIENERVLGPSLYPNDFILTLNEPNGYCGINQIFPMELDSSRDSKHIIPVPELDAESLREMVDEEKLDNTPIPESLEEAIMTYVLSWGVRCSTNRNQQKKHHSMLIHVKHTTETMTPIVRKVNDLINNWSLIIADEYDEVKGPELRQKFKLVWDKLYRDQLNNDKFQQPSWKEILGHISDFLSNRRPNVVEINYKSDDVLNYDAYQENGLRVIVIGGTRLSRGLTLEGLAVSYFVRHAGAHDTLLQMGRWFGFRQGYQDLMRIYMTSPIYEDFLDMVEIEQALRDDIVEYEANDLSPADFGVRVLKHHNDLKPTGTLKMREVELRSVNEDRKIFETPTLDLNDSEILENNLTVFDELISALLKYSSGKKCGFNNKNHLWDNIPPSMILDFLKNVNFEQSLYRMPLKQRIIPYISRRSKSSDDLSKWNVLNVGSRETDFTRISGSENLNVLLNGVMRTRIPETNRVGASIAGPWDYISDLVELGWKRSDFVNSNGSMSNELMFKHRPNKNPLLVTYLIDPESQPKETGRGSNRQPLFSDNEIKTPVLGIAIVLPKAQITMSERKSEREFYIRLGAASLEDILKARRNGHE
jgi:hypothetical protein